MEKSARAQLPFFKANVLRFLEIQSHLPLLLLLDLSLELNLDLLVIDAIFLMKLHAFVCVFELASLAAIPLLAQLIRFSLQLFLLFCLRF